LCCAVFGGVVCVCVCVCGARQVVVAIVRLPSAPPLAVELRVRSRGHLTGILMRGQGKRGEGERPGLTDTVHTHTHTHTQPPTHTHFTNGITPVFPGFLCVVWLLAAISRAVSHSAWSPAGPPSSRLLAR